LEEKRQSLWLRFDYLCWLTLPPCRPASWKFRSFARRKPYKSSSRFRRHR
jgi:RNA polymerase sigma-70 factor, ECF subfamily